MEALRAYLTPNARKKHRVAEADDDDGDDKSLSDMESEHAID